jgi:adenylate cyclase class 2
MEHLEIELKFMIPNLSGLRGRLQDLGAACIGERTFEHNIRCDTEDGRLQENNCLLRLRRDRDATLTYKSPPPAADARFKIHQEREVRVSDFDTMEAILNALGYVRCQHYEKWRETWQLHDAILCLDTMPFGRFLEIEGSPDTIMRIVHALGLDWKRRILSSYLRIFEILREKEGLDFSDLTFDNFNTVAVRFDQYAHLFEAGGE